MGVGLCVRIRARVHVCVRARASVCGVCIVVDSLYQKKQHVDWVPKDAQLTEEGCAGGQLGV